MKREDLIILILGLLLIAGMVLTFLFGGERSRHGVRSLRHLFPAGHHQGIVMGAKDCAAVPVIESTSR